MGISYISLATIFLHAEFIIITHAYQTLADLYFGKPTGGRAPGGRFLKQFERYISESHGMQSKLTFNINDCVSMVKENEEEDYGTQSPPKMYRM